VKPAPNRQNGFSLIELSIAAAIFSLGLAGVSLMLLTAITGTAEAGHQTFATNSAGSLAELIALNTDAAPHYANPQGAEAGICADSFDCSYAGMAAAEVNAWQRQLEAGLPNGHGLVCRDSTPDDGHSGDDACDGEGTLVVKVFWQEPIRSDENDDGRRRLVARIPVRVR
jgi:type IV pilus assembly protein PilV